MLIGELKKVTERQDFIKYLNKNKEDKDFFILELYINQSLQDDFKYNNNTAGSRPEIEEFRMRGNITETRVRLPQEVQNLMNQGTDAGSVARSLF